MAEIKRQQQGNSSRPDSFWGNIWAGNYWQNRAIPMRNTRKIKHNNKKAQRHCRSQPASQSSQSGKRYRQLSTAVWKAFLVWLSATPWTIAHQAPLSMGFSRQEYWSGLPCPPPGDLPNPGIETAPPAPPALQTNSSLLRHQGSPSVVSYGYLRYIMEMRLGRRSVTKKSPEGLTGIVFRSLAPSRIREMTVWLGHSEQDGEGYVMSHNRSPFYPKPIDSMS